MMRIFVTSLAVLVVTCAFDSFAAETKQLGLAAESRPEIERPGAEKTPAAKDVVAKTSAMAAAVKKHMTPAQLEMGDPILNSIGMVLVPIPAGEFVMGSPDSDKDAKDNERPQHLVEITKPFYLSGYEITQQQYEQVMGVGPWKGGKYTLNDPDYPATYVSWNDAVVFCRRLSEKEGVEYRLPTEVEWEYACRAETTTPYHFGDDTSKFGQYAWSRANALDIGEKYAHRGGQKLPNSWALYDMVGNVWEWCQDEYTTYEGGNPNSDPMRHVVAKRCVLRGGCFGLEPACCRPAFRSSGLPARNYWSVGFRIARSYP